MLTVEKAHLLLTRESGRSEAPSLHRVALAAAALADLREAGVVRIEDAPAPKARMWVTAGGTTGRPVLDALLPAVDGMSGKRVAPLVAQGKPDARRPVLARLTETGELEEHKAFLDTRHVPVTTTVKDGLVARLTAVALGDEEGSDEDRLLLGILKQLNVARRLLPGTHERESRKELGRRVDSLTRDDVLVQAVRGAVTPTVAAAV